MNDINYNKFKKSLLRLEERQSDYIVALDRKELLESDVESIQESCIHRFETCFDTLWKHLKKYLQETTGLAEMPNGSRPIFRLAVENRIIDDYETWYNYNIKRIGTSHDYSETKASEALEVIPSFIKDAIKLYEKMAQKKW